MKKIDNFEELTKSELLDLIERYDDYVVTYFEEHTEGIPVCMAEYYNNEYQITLKKGDLVEFGYFVDDIDLQDWLDNTEQKLFKVKEVDEESGIFWIEDCEFGILLNGDWERVLEQKQLNGYILDKYKKEFESEYIIDDLMKICDKEDLKELVVRTFRENIDLEELRDMFDDLTDEEFIKLLNEELEFCFEDIKDYNNRVDLESRDLEGELAYYEGIVEEYEVKGRGDKKTYIFARNKITEIENLMLEEDEDY